MDYKLGRKETVETNKRMTRKYEIGICQWYIIYNNMQESLMSVGTITHIFE